MFKAKRLRIKIATNCKERHFNSHFLSQVYFFFQHAPCVLQPNNKKTKQWNYNFGHFLKKKLKVKCVIFWQPRVGYVQSQSRCLSSAIFNNLVIVSNTKPHICKCHIVNFDVNTQFTKLTSTQLIQNLRCGSEISKCV